MPVYKCVLQWVAYQDDWKEIFYVTQGSPALALAVFSNSFLAAAGSFRSGGCYVSSITVQDIAQPRSAVSRTLAVPPPSSSGSRAPDLRSATALYTLGSVGRGSRRNLFVRGLVDVDVQRNGATGAPDPAASLTGGMDAYIAAMVTAGLQIQSLVPLTPTADPYRFYDITQITVAAGGRCTLTMEAGAVLTAANRVKLSLFDAKLWPGLNGTYTARQVAGLNFQISYKADVPPAVYPVQRGHFRNVDYRYLTISSAPTDSYFVRFSSRDTKSGPFGGRGAKKGVRLRYR